MKARHDSLSKQNKDMLSLNEEFDILGNMFIRFVCIDVDEKINKICMSICSICCWSQKPGSLS